MWRFSLIDSVYNTCYFGLYVSEMGLLLSFLFINAWTSQFFIDEPDGLQQAKDLSEKITTSAMVIGLFMGFALGHSIDKFRITPILIGCYVLRGLGLVSMTCIFTDFERQKGLLYCSFIAMTAGTFC